MFSDILNRFAMAVHSEPVMYYILVGGATIYGIVIVWSIVEFIRERIRIYRTKEGLRMFGLSDSEILRYMVENRLY